MEEIRTNVAVYVDYENIHKTLLKEKTNVLREGFFEKLRKWCSDKGKRIVQTRVYCNFDNEDMYQSHHQSILQSYGVETIHTSNQGKNYADLKISIDVLTSMYSNDNIDEFIIVSNDKDMIPLLNSIRENKRNVCVITAGNDYNRSICEFADQHKDFHKICKTKVDHLIINDIKERYWKNFHSSIDDKINRFFKGEPYTHCSLPNNIKKSMGYFKLMSYEILTIIKELYSEGKIVFYSYGRSNNTVAMVPADKVKFFVNNSIIKKDKIIKNFDINKEIEKEYNSFLRT